jgi:hypothetical protein
MITLPCKPSPVAVRAEGMNISPLAIHGVPNREKAVEALVI